MSDRSTSADKSERSASASHAHVSVALDFIQRFLSGETMLVAWSANGAAPQAKAFSIPADLGQVRTWLEKRSHLNLGYVLNQVRRTAPQNKVPSAKDVVACRGIVLDVDRAEGETRAEAQARVRAKLDDFRKTGFEPTFAISTGNGAQFGWLFDEPVTLEPGEVSAKAVIEDRSKALSELHGGDATQSVSHFFRLPFGRNLPSKRKRCLGWDASTPGLLAESGHRYPFEHFRRILDASTPTGQNGKGATDASHEDFSGAAAAALASSLDKTQLDELKARLGDDIKKLIETGPTKDRSTFDFALGALCRQAGLSVTEVAQVLAACGSEKVHERGDAYLATTLRNVWEKGDGPAREVFDNKVLLPTIDGYGSRSGVRWREFERLLAALKAARSDVIGGRFEAERFDCQTPDPSELDDPHVSNFHTRGEVTFTVAEPERGKTLLAVLNALAVAHERPDLFTDQFRHDVTEVNDWAGAVVLVLNETSGRAHQLLRAAEAINGLKRADMKHPIFIYGKHLVIAERSHSDVVEPSQGLFEFLRRLIELRCEEEIALIVFDTLASMTAGLPENSAEAMSIVTEIFDKIAKASFAAVDVLHHTAKQSRETGGFAPRGSGALGAAARSMRTIELAARLWAAESPPAEAEQPRSRSGRSLRDPGLEETGPARPPARRVPDGGGRRTEAADGGSPPSGESDVGRGSQREGRGCPESREGEWDAFARRNQAAGQGCQRTMDNAVGACRAHARRETGRSEEDTAGPRNKRCPAPQADSGRRREANCRGVRTCVRRIRRRCRPQSRRRSAPAGILTWPGSGPTFHTADGSA